MGQGEYSNAILIVEDEALLRTAMGDHLRDRGFEVLEAGDGQSGLELFRRHRPALVTLDIRMAPMDGHAMLAALREFDLETPVIVVSGLGLFDDVVLALRNGAFDYIQKPINDMAVFDRAVERALERVALRRGNAMLSRSFLSKELEHPEAFSEIFTVSKRMRDIFRYCEAVAQSAEAVLITGETGVGKELLARAIHLVSRRAGSFVAVNVAGLDDQAFSDTLFGHVRGAFTGADKSREGLLEKAAAGTIFLDEIGDLSGQAQVRLLRVLQEREFYPLGSDSPRRHTARILAATNKSLEDLRQGNQFRRDFYHRLATHCVALPPLRERQEDIPVLLRRFLEQESTAQGKLVPECAPGLLPRLRAYPFPGNVRELRAMVCDALGRTGDGVLGVEAFPPLLSVEPAKSPSAGQENLFADFEPLPTIRAATDALVAEAMRRASGVQKTAALMLGISPQALSERLKRR